MGTISLLLLVACVQWHAVGRSRFRGCGGSRLKGRLAVLGAVMKDVFISYSSKDSDLAREIRACVEREGHSCWMAPDDIKGRKTFAEQILEAIRVSRAMIVVISSGANASDHMPREVSLASDANTPILPVRVEDVLPSGALQYLLQLRHWVDAFPGPIEDHVESLKEAIDAVLQEGDDGSAVGSGQAEVASSPAAAPWLEYLGVLSTDASSTLWRAHDTMLGRDIVVKELHVPEDMSPEEASLQWERIDSEVTKAAALKHPNVGEVYGAWRTGDRFMISAELLQGETLESRLSLGPLATKTTLGLLLQIASAVSYSHRKGVAHAGVRPWNVFLTPEGSVRLAGGGVSFSPQVAQVRDGPRPVTVDPMGSAGYVAPEQLQGRLPDELADEFSLAVLANEMLTGQNPFGARTGADEDEIVRRTLEEALPRIAGSVSEFPQAAAVDEVLSRASAKDPARRYPSVAEFWTALREAWSADAPVMAPQVVAAAAAVAATAPAEAAATAAVAAPVESEDATAPAAAPVATATIAAALPVVKPVAHEGQPVEASRFDSAAVSPAETVEFAEASSADYPAEPDTTADTSPRMSRRARTVLIGGAAGVVTIGLLVAASFALGRGGGFAPTEKPPETPVEAVQGPTADELLDSASEALASGEYSVATSEAAAALKMDATVEASATAVITEAKKLSEVARLKPAAETAYAKKQWSEAVTAYARLVKLDPENKTFKKRLSTARLQVELYRLYSLGRKYERARSWSKAKRTYEKVLAKDKKYRDTAKRLARVKAALNPPSASSGSSSGGSGSGGSSSGGSGSGGGGEEF